VPNRFLDQADTQSGKRRFSGPTIHPCGHLTDTIRLMRLSDTAGSNVVHTLVNTSEFPNDNFAELSHEGFRLPFDVVISPDLLKGK
jgi:hypothetical protein